jgi:hypothetical protein
MEAFYNKNHSFSYESPLSKKEVWGPCYVVVKKDYQGYDLVTFGQTKADAIKAWNEANKAPHTWKDY